MVPFAILCFLGGAILALRFRVLILVPTILAAWVATVGVAVPFDHSIGFVVSEMALFAGVQQLGFLSGIAVRYSIAGYRRSRPRSLAKRPLLTDSVN
jgi:hypothetical protein